MSVSDETLRTNKSRFYYGSYIIVASWIMLFLVGAISMSIFFKPMLEDFGLDRATLSLIQTIAMLVFAVVSPFLGRIIDRFGPKVMLFICVATQTLTSLINGLANSIFYLFIARFLWEVKGMHASQVLVNRWYVKKRGRAQGIVATGWPVGALVLSPISQYLVESWGWRITMFFWAGVTFVILLTLTIFIRDNPQDKGYAPDGVPLQRATSSDIDIHQAENSIITGSGLSEYIKDNAFWLLLATQFICGIGCGFMGTHIVIFATDMGYSAMIGATFLSVQGGANLVGVLITGHMSDRIARNRVLALTHAIRSISFFAVIIFIILNNGNLWLLYIAMGLFGFGWFTTAPLAAGLVPDLFDYRHMGTILGVILSCHIIGMALGAFAGGITYEMTQSYFLFFIIQGILEFLAAICAFSIKRRVVYE